MSNSTSTCADTPADALLTPSDVADLLRVSPGTLANWRSQGRGPAYVRLADGPVRYEAADVSAWLAAQPRRGGAA